MTEIRKTNLGTLIERRSEGNTSLFCKIYGLDPGYLWQLLNGRRSFGEKSARNIEKKVGVTAGFLDKESLTLEELLGIGLGDPYADNSLGHGPKSAKPESLDAVKSHIFKLPKSKQIQVKSFAQILNNEQGNDTMIVFGDLPNGAYGYVLELDHMEGLPVFIQRGAGLVVDPDLEPVEGDVVLANIGERPAIGLFSHVGGKGMLMATRDKIPAVEVAPDQVLGVVLKWAVEHRNPGRK